ncbi:hypothetical protein HIM_02363 [Hirsutella minnesotensis 3608]|nr:hypothetical protein HIM_02363 [Hirsutella minnesotensis 3608]
MSSAQWHGNGDRFMGAPNTGDDELSNFLEVNGMADFADQMHFDLHDFQHSAPQDLMGRQQGDMLMTDASLSAAVASTHDGLLPQHTPLMPTSTQMSAPTLATSAPDTSIPNIDAQIQYLQRQKLYQQQRQLQDQRAAFFNPNHSVPPTPQSLELTSGAGRIFSPSDHMSRQAAYDPNYQQRIAEQQDMAFTPLMSPAVTPLDPHFNLDNVFSAPGAYFSPLTSPALHAQQDALTLYDHGAPSNESPVETDLELPAMGAPAPHQDMPKKTKKSTIVKARSKASIKSSPIAKPQRRKTGPSPAIVSQVLSEVEGRSLWPGDQAMLPLPASSTESSEENASVSPENLTDMPPPPIPHRRSTSDSPYLRPQTGKGQTGQQNVQRVEAGTSSAQGSAHQQQQPHPATPASLMKLPPSKTKRQAASSPERDPGVDIIESLELPESMASGPLESLSGSFVTSAPRGERSLTRETAAPPLPSPAIGSLDTGAPGQSPQLLPGPPGTTTKKTPKLLPRNSRKRSTSSIHASPALLPKISPNIKPLLPGTPSLSAAEDTASRLLMSKSNYQNILEGNTVPGVSYPSELSTNLTSKRTSHKIAEQGRRNRINSALQIMAGLLPDQQHVIEEGDENEKKEGKQCNVQNSKASVVENAIVHMKKLQKENGDLRQQVQELQQQLQTLKESATDS